MDCDNCGEVIVGREFFIIEDTASCTRIVVCSAACLSETADELLAEEHLNDPDGIALPGEDPVLD